MKACLEASEMADTEFDETSIDSQSFDDDNASDRNSNTTHQLTSMIRMANRYWDPSCQIYLR